MAGKDRKRQIARQRYERKMAAMAARRAQMRRRWTIGGSTAGAVIAIVAIVLAFVLPSNGKKPASAVSPVSSSSPSSSASPAASGSPVAAAPTSASGCTFTPAKPASAAASALPSGAAVDLKTEPTGITVPSGSVPTTIQVKDLVVGTGPAASPHDTVNVNYVGMNYVDCKEFDSSWSRGAAASFSLDQVVPGFTKGIGGATGIAPMKVGGRREIIVPPGDGYGPAGSPPTIQPNEELIFVVDLLGTTAPSPSASGSGPTGPVS